MCRITRDKGTHHKYHSFASLTRVNKSITRVIIPHYKLPEPTKTIFSAASIPYLAVKSLKSELKIWRPWKKILPPSDPKRGPRAPLKSSKEQEGKQTYETEKRLNALLAKNCNYDAMDLIFQLLWNLLSSSRQKDYFAARGTRRHRV